MLLFFNFFGLMVIKGSVYITTRPIILGHPVKAALSGMNVALIQVGCSLVISSYRWHFGGGA